MTEKMHAAPANHYRPKNWYPPITAIPTIDTVTKAQDGTLPISQNACVHHLVEAQANRSPLAPAIADGDTVVTYEALNRRANQFAHLLRAKGVRPNVPIGVCLDRSAEMVVAVLAILKAGGAYLPLDPSYPSERLKMMIGDACVPLGISRHTEMPECLRSEIPWFDVDDNDSVIAAQPGTNLTVGSATNDLGYVMYTSGSTGRPKGVAMPHRPLVNLMRWQLQNFAMSHPARTLQFASLNFDVSFQEIFSTWLSGGTLVLMDESTRRDPYALLSHVREHGVQRVFLPVVAFRYLADAARETGNVPESLREIITAGEALEISTSIEWMIRRLPEVRVQNQYGPSETHVVTAYSVPSADCIAAARPPIGLPISNVYVEVLDDRLRRVPQGDAGELYIGGDALARGYFERPELTAERFLSDPFRAEDGRRLYRTGDMVRYLKDGNLEFLGRRDDQIKIRGHRVEPGEIVATLESHPEVLTAVVLVDEDSQRNKRLLAYAIVADRSSLHLLDLFEWVDRHLPPYMRPAAISILDHLPLSPNGKVDRAALASIRHSCQGPQIECQDPRTRVEFGLLRIWESLLDRRPISVADDFFELGGDSLLAMDLLFRIEREFGVRVAAAQLMDATSLEELAAVIHRQSTAPRESPLVAIQREGKRRPFFCVHPAGGNPFCYLKLAEALGRDQPFFAFQAIGIDVQGEPVKTVEEMAADYVRELRQIQPVGPYSIGGWSFGGTVAYEMARQLQQQGDDVPCLVVMDAGIMYSVEVMQWLFPSEQIGIFELLRRPKREQIARFRKRTSAAHLFPAGAEGELVERIYEVILANIRAMLDYRPQPHAGKVTLVMASDRIPQIKHDPYQEWADLCDEIVLHEVSGNHLTMVHPPHVDSLAECLQQCLVDPESIEASALADADERRFRRDPTLSVPGFCKPLGFDHSALPLR